MPQPAALNRLIEEFVERRPMRSKSLIVTVFGDVVSQHGHILWLGSLVGALKPLGISERLVRTSVFRLVQEGWLESERAGRRSYYRFSDYGNNEYERAAKRIYAVQELPWTEQWQLLIPLDVPEDVRESFRRSLYWQGFRNIATNTFAKPGFNGNALQEILAHFKVTDQVLLMEAKTSQLIPGKSVRKLVNDCWNLDEIATDYQDFLQRFKPLIKWLQGNKKVQPQACFLARILLIHDYRRLLLKDTLLPEALLPNAWPGAQARELTAKLYHLLAEPTNAYITTELEGSDGQLNQPCRRYWSRFDPIDQ